MSARGGQWIAAGALVIVGLGIIIYLSRKQRKKPANLPNPNDNNESQRTIDSDSSNDLTTVANETQEKTNSYVADLHLETSRFLQKVHDSNSETNESKKTVDEKKRKAQVPKSLEELKEITPVIEKPLTAENTTALASSSHVHSPLSSPGNGTKTDKNETKNKAISPDKLCERLEKTAPPESEKTISLKATPTKSEATKITVQKTPVTPNENIQVQMVSAGTVLSPNTNSAQLPPGGATKSQILPSGPVLSPTVTPTHSQPGGSTNSQNLPAGPTLSPTSPNKQVVPNEPQKSAQDSKPITKSFTKEEITDSLLLAQNSPGMLSAQNAEVLVSILTHPDPSLRQSALMGINKCSTFTRNQNLLREYGCLTQLSCLLRQQVQGLSNMSQNASASVGDPEKSTKTPDKMSEKFMNLLATAINNLSSNEQNHKQFEDCVPMLVDIALEEETGESVRLSSLQALTNLSVMDHHHSHYTRIVQKLYDFLDDQSLGIRLQAVKILVNLSCNPELVPHMLAAKAPSCVLELLRTGAEESLILRWTTFLANILHTVKESHLSASSLPPNDKAPSPETMYSALYSMNNIGQIKSKVFLLCRHRNEDIKLQASRIYQTLNAK